MLLISSLERGGAERQVVGLANSLDPRRFEVVVCSLSTHVPLAAGLLNRDRRLRIVDKRWPYDLTVIPRVVRLMRELQTQIVHAFLFDAEMVSRVAARVASVPVVVASERNTDYRRPWSHWVCQRMTRSWFDLMIANTESGKRFNMRTLGLEDTRIHVIRNGVDTDRFRPLDRVEVRRRMGIGPERPVVGMIAAFKRQKKHDDFFRMAQAVLKRWPDALFLCVGEPLRDNLQQAGAYHRRMLRLLASLGLREHFLFLGNRDDMPEVYNACDVTVLTSSREGTPNVLLESMACGVPVVATDVADNASLVPQGEGGFVVPLGDVDAMSGRVCELLSDKGRRETMGRRARHRVLREYSTEVLARKTEDLYRSALMSKLAKRNGRYSPANGCDSG